MKADNVMWGHENTTGTSNRDHFTVGQVYRMNVDFGSWLHRLYPNRPFKCCQCNAYTNDPCPDLWIDLKEVKDPGNFDDVLATRTCVPWWEDQP
jgi:hypothetical protein